MQPKMKLKMAIDLLMTVALLGLMAYQLTGQRLHEQLGAGMLALFLLHNLLNLRWYGNLFKGSYRPLRITQTLVNLGVLAAMLCLGFSGIVLSRYVFPDVGGPLATARRMHLAASYWGFALMSVHLGMHWGMILGMFRKLRGGKRLTAAAARAATASRRKRNGNTPAAPARRRRSIRKRPSARRKQTITGTTHMKSRETTSLRII